MTRSFRSEFDFTYAIHSNSVSLCSSTYTAVPLNITRRKLLHPFLCVKAKEACGAPVHHIVYLHTTDACTYRGGKRPKMNNEPKPLHPKIQKLSAVFMCLPPQSAASLAMRKTEKMRVRVHGVFLVSHTAVVRHLRLRTVHVASSDAVESQKPLPPPLKKNIVSSTCRVPFFRAVW